MEASPPPQLKAPPPPFPPPPSPLSIAPPITGISNHSYTSVSGSRGSSKRRCLLLPAASHGDTVRDGHLHRLCRSHLRHLCELTAVAVASVAASASRSASTSACITSVTSVDRTSNHRCQQSRLHFRVRQPRQFEAPLPPASAASRCITWRDIVRDGHLHRLRRSHLRHLCQLTAVAVASVAASASRTVSTSACITSVTSVDRTSNHRRQQSRLHFRVRQPRQFGSAVASCIVASCCVTSRRCP